MCVFLIGQKTEIGDDTLLDTDSRIFGEVSQEEFDLRGDIDESVGAEEGEGVENGVDKGFGWVGGQHVDASFADDL